MIKEIKMIKELRKIYTTLYLKEVEKARKNICDREIERDLYLFYQNKYLENFDEYEDIEAGLFLEY